MNQIVTAETDKARVLFVNAPDATKDFAAVKVHYSEVMKFGFENKIGDVMSMDMPPGDWQYLCLLNVATREQAAVIVDDSKKLFGGYRYDYKKRANVAADDVASLRSLAQSVGVDTNKNWAVCFELKRRCNPDSR